MQSIILAVAVGMVAATVPLASRRWNPALAALLAAAPVTPTAAALLAGPAIDWGAGLCLVAGATAGRACAARTPFGKAPVLLGIAVAALATAALLALDQILVAVGVLGVALVIGERTPRARSPNSAQPFSWGRWAVQAAAVGLGLAILPFVAHSNALLAGLLASAPMLLVASLVMTRISSGRPAVSKMIQASFAPSAGVVAFVATLATLPQDFPAGMALVLAWGFYAVTAGAWVVGWRFARRLIPPRAGLQSCLRLRG